MDEEWKKSFIEKLRKDKEDAYERYKLAEAEKKIKRKFKLKSISKRNFLEKKTTDEDSKEIKTNTTDVLLENGGVEKILEKDKIASEKNYLNENQVIKEVSEKENRASKDDVLIENEHLEQVSEIEGNKNKDIFPKHFSVEEVMGEELKKKRSRKKKNPKKKNTKKALSEIKYNYNTYKSRLRRARLTEEQKAIIREKDKLRKRKARSEGKILRIKDMTKTQKKVQRNIWRDTKRSYRKRKKSLINTLNETPPSSETEDHEEIIERQETPLQNLVPIKIKNFQREEKSPYSLRTFNSSENNNSF